jgi:hypothetical protein
MLFYLASWTLLIVFGAAVGSAWLAITKSSMFSHFGDRMITATWLGLLTIAAILLGLSVVLPLSPAVGLSLVVLLGTVALSAKSVRREFERSLSYLTKPVGMSLVVVAVVVALNSTRLVEAYDTGLYHYPLTHWLSSYGTVPGLALIHFRFGFSSSWFALAAPFDFGPFQGRISALLGGLAILLCLCHFALAISRILQRRADTADWFLSGGYIFVLLVCFSWAFEVSLSPDVPVWILTLLVGWLMLVSGADRSKASRTSSEDGPIVVLILALCTIALKPSAAPIAVTAGLFYWFSSPSTWITRLVSGSVAGLVVVPVVVANVASSGCPLYPNSTLCLEVPWGVGKAGAREVAAGIADWGRWRDATSSAANAGNWMVAWISQPDKLVLVAFCSLCILGFLALRGWRAHKSFPYVLGLALFGTAFLFVNAPNPRFGVGYFSLYPALFLVAAGPKLERLVRSRWAAAGGLKRPTTLAYVLVAIAAMVAVQGSVRDHRLRGELASAYSPQVSMDSKLLDRLLLPPALASSQGDLVVVKNRRLSRIGRLDLAPDRSNGIEYRSPKDRDQCWAATLPCVPAPLEGDVGLRSPANGFRSGFMRLAKVGDVSRRSR